MNLDDRSDAALRASFLVGSLAPMMRPAGPNSALEVALAEGFAVAVQLAARFPGTALALAAEFVEAEPASLPQYLAAAAWIAGDMSAAGHFGREDFVEAYREYESAVRSGAIS